MDTQFVVLNSFGATLGPNSFAILDDDHIAYICGRYVCIHRTREGVESATQDSVQKFIPCMDESISLHAICASPSSSRVKSLAYAEMLCLFFLH